MFGLLREFCEICEKSGGLSSFLADWLRIGCRMLRKTVLYIVCFAYSLLSLVAVVVSTLLSSSQSMSFVFYPFCPPHPSGGEGEA